MSEQSAENDAPCPICGVRYCALLATTNASGLAEWRALHTRPIQSRRCDRA